MAESTTPAPKYDPYPFDLPALLKLGLVGFVAGVAGWLLYLLVANYFVEPVFCSSADTFSICKNGGTIAWVTAHIVVMAAVVAVLAKMAYYRPLLVVLGVLTALWGAHAWLGVMDWWQAALWQGLLFALATALFGWIARTTSFVIALVAAIVVAVAARVLLTLS